MYQQKNACKLFLIQIIDVLFEYGQVYSKFASVSNANISNIYMAVGAVWNFDSAFFEVSGRVEK